MEELAEEQGKLNHTYDTMETSGWKNRCSEGHGLRHAEVCTWPGGPVWLKTKVATDCRVSPCSEEERMSRMGYDEH